jgi:hypothetical protein
MAPMFGNAIAKRMTSLNKMTQLPQSRTSRISERFRQIARKRVPRSAAECTIQHHYPLSNFQMKKHSLSSCTKIQLPIKKRGPRF